MGNPKYLQALIIAVLFTIQISAQNTLVVYKVHGEVLLQQNENPLHVGFTLTENDRVFNNNGSAIFLDEYSNLYELKENGEKNFNELKAVKKPKSKSVNDKYLSYVYHKFLKKETHKTIAGGVYRGTNPIMTPSLGDYFMKRQNIEVRWRDTGSKKYYISIQNVKGKIVQQYEVSSTSYQIRKKLKKGMYRLNITTTPLLDNVIDFVPFEIVSKKEYRKRKQDEIYEGKKYLDLMMSTNEQ